MRRFNSNGNLPPGIHEMTWTDFVMAFGQTQRRQRLLTGLLEGLKELRAAGWRGGAALRAGHW